MNYFRFHKPRSWQRGAAAVEAALIMPLLIVLIAAPLFLCRYFWYYSVLQRAAHDAARVLASATKYEIGTNKPDLSEVDVAKLARTIATVETEEVAGASPHPVEISCDALDCIGDGVPATVSVAIRTKIYDPVFGTLTDGFGGRTGLWVKANVTMPYVGN